MTNIADDATYGKTLQTALTSGQVDPSKSGVLMKGAVPPARVSGFSYTATTTSITWVWKGLTIYRTDGTQISIPNGSQAVTGLNANETYQFYPYYDEATATFKWVTTSDVSFPSFTLISLAGAGEVTTTTSLSLGTGNQSIELWFSTTTATTPLVLLSTVQTGAPGSLIGNYQYHLSLVSGAIDFVITNGAGTETINSPLSNYNDGNLHHVVAVVSTVSPFALLYVDGVLVNENFTAFGPTSHTGFWRIGRDFSGFATAKLSHVATYDGVALSAGQVSLHYSAGLNTSQTAYENAVANDSPTSFWHLTETSGTTAADSAGTNTGTYAGTVTLNQSQAVDAGVGSPAYAWIQPSILTAQSQSLQGRSPLSAGSMSASTPATGTGGGSAGGSTGGGSFGGGVTPPQGCFSGNTKVKTQRGAISFSDLKVGDLVLTARKTWKPVARIIIHENWSGLVHDMGNGQLITSNHPVLDRGEWKAAEHIFGGWSSSSQTVFNLEVQTESDDDVRSPDSEHSFTLSNGLVAHNFKLI
ncbi:MAG: hypothetical protein ACYDCM_07195 [Candidatus Acidiferrales bacterium]